KLFHKSKSGKNGKKVIVARKENVFIDQTKEKSFTLDSEPNTAELEKILWPKYDTLGDDILLKYTESFKKSLDETVDDFFKKVDKELAK
ncbi:MAG: hypothetical protein KAI79_08220, partial [Bacteroidales bacterium]|nr:hypothetical protein [Bacteroidales bacterium]